MSDLIEDSFNGRLRYPLEWADHLKRTNRFCLPSDKSGFIDWVIQRVRKEQTLLMKEDREVFCRARIHKSGQEDAYPPKEMGAPPPDLAPNGRISPEGIPCLYLSDTCDTSISENRPWRGALLSVARFQLRKQHKFADMRIPDSIWKQMLPAPTWEAWDYFMLISEIMKPAQEKSAVDYAPTQYLSARLKHDGYDGIIYPSTMCQNGYNLAIFNPIDAVDLVGKVEVYKVTKVDIQAKQRIVD